MGAKGALLLCAFAAAVSCERTLKPGDKHCPKGKFDSGLAKGCVECPPGHFKHSDGAGMCTPCPVNTYAAGPGSTACEGCLRGEVSLLGQKLCQLCPAGTFASKGACEQCGHGSSSEEGSETCTCNKGWTGLPQGSYTASCDQCVLMGFAPNQQLRCTCKNGKGHDVRSALLLSTCQNGEWVGNVDGILSCQPVPLGFEGRTRGGGAGQQGRQAVCKKCPANTFKAVRGPGACQACPFGLVSAEASEDVQQCVAEDVIGSLQVHFVSFVKGAGSSLGFSEEEPSERRWRQHAFEAVALNADHANAQLTSALSAASERIYTATQYVLSHLHRMVLELFASAAEFLSVRAKQEEEGDSSRMCSSPGALREWLNNRNEYHAWRDAVRAVRAERNSGSSCARMRKAARHLLLVIHPDKFAMIHPACPRDMSTPLAAEFSSEYDKHKTLCAGQ